MQNKIFRPIVKTHGGKNHVKDFIIDHFPKNYEELVYCEPMCAGASILLNKIPSKKEVISDLDVGIINILKATRDESQEFIDRLKKIKYTESNFKKALEQTKFEDYIDHAINEYILRRMSRGGMKKAFAWSERLRGGKPGDVNAWETMLDQLLFISDRLKNVTILNKSVFEMMKIWDEEDCFTYLDPPYLPETRAKGSISIYEYEMTTDNHVSLLNVIKNARGKVMISGYYSSLYNKELKDWQFKKKTVTNNSGQTKTKEKRTECIWFNY